MDPEAARLDHPEGASAQEAVGDGLRRLFRRLAAGDMSALDGIYDAMAKEMYGMALWRTGSTTDAEDVVQTAFVRLAERRERLSEVQEPRSYLLAMTHRAAIDLRRGAAARSVRLPDDAAFVRAPASDPDRALDARRAAVALRALPAVQREAIFLHHFSGLTFRAVARVTGVPTFTAASRFRNGILALRRLMGLSR